MLDGQKDKVIGILRGISRILDESDGDFQYVDSRLWSELWEALDKLGESEQAQYTMEHSR